MRPTIRIIPAKEPYGHAQVEAVLYLVSTASYDENYYCDRVDLQQECIKQVKRALYHKLYGELEQDIHQLKHDIMSRCRSIEWEKTEALFNSVLAELQGIREEMLK